MAEEKSDKAMAEEKSDKAYDYYQAASLRFDYFVTGATGALAAFVGQTIKPHRIGFNAETLELIALLILVSSIIAGLKRLEEITTLFKFMTQKLTHEEARKSLISASSGGFTLGQNMQTGEILHPAQMMREASRQNFFAEEYDKELEKMSTKAHSYYKWRNRLLLVGFLVLILARILPAYR